MTSIYLPLIVDNFQRANEPVLGAPWVSMFGTGFSLQLINKTVTIQPGVDVFAPAVNTNISLNASDQFIRATIGNLTTSKGYLGLVLRGTPNGSSFYYCALDASPGFGGIGRPPMTTPFNVFKVPGFSLIGQLGFVTPLAGDEITLQMQGNTVTGWYNGVQIGSPVVDATPLTTTLPGIFVQGVGTPASSDLSWTKWSAGIILNGIPFNLTADQFRCLQEILLRKIQEIANAFNSAESLMVQQVLASLRQNTNGTTFALSSDHIRYVQQLLNMKVQETKVDSLTDPIFQTSNVALINSTLAAIRSVLH